MVAVDDDERVWIASLSHDITPQRERAHFAERPAKERGRGFALNGGEPQEVVALVGENELHRSIAEAARPVEEHDRTFAPVGARLLHGTIAVH
jgi:hypothetical protein